MPEPGVPIGKPFDEVPTVPTVELTVPLVTEVPLAVEVVEIEAPWLGAPKGGRVAIAGPSFEYFASPEFHGTDSLTLQVTGSKLRVAGTSSIQVDVTIP